MPCLSRRRLIQSAALSTIAPLVLRAGNAQAQSNEAQLLVERARVVVEEFLATPAKDDMHVYIQNAYGVMVLPDVLKGGLLIGAEYGTGVMLLRDLRTGTFGEPAFFTLAGGSFGLQIGGKSSDLLLTFMNDGAITKLLSSNFKIGTDVSATAGKLGAGLGAATTAHFGEDIYIFSHEQGLYAGVSLDGSALKPKDAYNQMYYGQPVTATQILRDRSVSNMNSQQLRETLARF